VARTVG